MDVHESQPSSPSSAGLLHGAHDVHIDRATLTSVGGNSLVNPSNTFILIKQESGMGFLSMLVLLLFTFLFCRLL
jgi:hypothetical protein